MVGLSDQEKTLPRRAENSLLAGQLTYYAFLSQEFVSHECDTSELGPSRFSTMDVHRIGILDVRLYNTDRCVMERGAELQRVS